MHRFSVVTLFPELLAAFGAAGMVRKACVAGLAEIHAFNPRDFSDDARGTVDDAPYGGGPGMVMMVKPLRRAIQAARHGARDGHVIYLSPQGRRLTQAGVAELAAHPHLVLVAGRYEGVDERVVERDVDEEWSLGDFVLSGGEIAAMAVIDAIVRLLPGVLGDARSAAADSFSAGLLDHPHYTRPESIDGQPVPPVLLSGNHARIAAWRRQAALLRTARRRPDLLAAAPLDEDDRRFLAGLASDAPEQA